MEFKYGLSDHVVTALEQLETEDSTFAGLRQVLSEAKDTLRPLPSRVQITMVSNLDREYLGADFLTGLATLFAHTEARLRVLYYVSSYRLLDLLEMVVAGLNGGRFAGVMLGSRSLVEHAAISRWRQRQLMPLLEAVDGIRPSTLRRCKGNGNLTSAVVETLYNANSKLEETYAAGRFDRGVLSKPREIKSIELDAKDPLRQVGIMDAIDELNWSGPLLPATNARFYYELLCDYVHPNVGSNFMHIDRENYEDIRNLHTNAANRLVHMEIAADTLDKSLCLHVLSAMAIPVREATKDLIDYSRWLERHLEGRRQFGSKLRESGIKDISRSV